MTISSFNKPVICPVLIGRSSELAALQGLVEQTKSGKGQVALLSGEAGVGKSRLVGETKTYAASQGFLLHQGNCFPTDRSCPYAPVLDLLRSLFATRSPAEIAAEVRPFAHELFWLLPDIVRLSPDQPPLPVLDREQEKRRLFVSLVQFLTDQAAKQPVLLIVEDLHWSDDTSLEFLHYLARRCVAQPLALLLTYRNDEIHPSLRHWLAQVDREHLAQEFVLARLTRNDVEMMLRAIFDLRRSARLELPDPIYRLTEGNPFFIEEVLKTLLTVGEIFYVDGAWHLKPHKGNPASRPHIPRSVQDAVQQRTDQLSEGARQVLVLAAVAGRHFDFALLQQLTQHDEQQLLALMKELIAAQLVVEESAERFGFRHALTRQAVYAELLARERKALHRTIGETMERLYASVLDGHLADLAYHFYEAGAWENVLEYAQRAGEKAQALYAPHAAVEHFTHALDASYHLSATPLSTLLHARGQAYESLGDFEHSRADYEAALQIARATDKRQAEWEALLSLGMLWTERDYERSGEYYTLAFELARTMDAPSMLARSLNRLGNWHLNLERPLEALQYHREALTIFQELQDARGLAETLDLLGMASYLGGDLIQGTAYYQQAIELFGELGDRQGLTSSLATLTLRGPTHQTNTMVSAVSSLAEVAPDGQMALKIAREIGQRSAESYALFLSGFCLGAQGEYARALELAQSGLEIAEGMGHRQWMTGAHCSLGTLYLDLFALTEAQHHLEQALVLANEMYSWHWIHVATGNLASTYILQHELMQAETILTAGLTAETPTQTLGQRLAWHACAELALARGNPVLALQIVDQLSTSAANLSSEGGIPRLSKLRGEALIMLNRSAEAEATLLSAQEVALRQGVQPLVWRIAVVLGKLYQAQERHEEAEQAFSAARTVLEELAANVSDERLRENFLRQATAMLPPHRSPISPKRAAKQAFAGLTMREREVAKLIAQGKSNREIANALVVSERTAETHVSSILSKQGFTSRTQIATWAVEKGLAKDSE